MAKKQRQWYYVSHYEEYPIYEAAEGGYYYAGNALHKHYRFGSLKRARKCLKELALGGDFDVVTKNYARRNSRHIGEGEEIRIETVLGKSESGYRPYS